MNPTPRCVIHCRVSTAKQAYEGESLEVQRSICLDIASRNGWTLAHEPWLESYSGRKDVRPVFADVIAFLDAHPGQVRYYVFRAIDRFTRGGTGMYEQMKAALARRGVELVDSMGVIQPIKNTLEHVGFEYEWSRVSPSEVAEAVLATTAKAEATTILTRLIGQEIRLTQHGYKIREAVDGYRNERIQVDGKRRVVQVPDPERAHFYRAMFELRAEGQLTDAQIVERINAMGFRSRVRNRWDPSHQRVIAKRGGIKLSVKRYQEVIKRPIYCGVVWEKWTSWRPVRAAYDGLVSIDTWNAANRGSRAIWDTSRGLELQMNVGPAHEQRSKNNPQYPFRRVVLCPICHKPFLGSASRSRSGRHVPAYHCARNHPRLARNKSAFEGSVRAFIGGLRFEHSVVRAAVELVYQRYGSRGAELAAQAAECAKAVAALEAQKADAARAFLSATTDTMRRALEREVERLDREIAQAQVQGERLAVSEADLDDYLHMVEEIMEHPALLLENAENPRLLRSRFDLAFEQLPTLTEIESGTAKLSAIMHLCEGEEDPRSVQVRPRGFSWNLIEADILRWKRERLLPPNQMDPSEYKPSDADSHT